MSTMRVAIAGTGGLARLIAHHIQEDTSHNAILLSRSPQPGLKSNGYQVAVVDYDNSSTLTFALRGIETVISTVTGTSQIELIKAAVHMGVRRFIPAEFSGPPEWRVLYDQIDSKRIEALNLLDRYSGQMPSTYFVCGIFYEHFQPGGLGSSDMGAASGFNAEGDYIMNCRSMETQLYVPGPNQQPNAAICMTSVHDVARYVCKALDLARWPKQIRMCGARLQITELISRASQLRGQPFRVRWHSPESLRSELQGATAREDRSQQKRIQAHINTVEGRYVFSPTDLQQTFGDARMIDFDRWFSSKWVQG